MPRTVTFRVFNNTGQTLTYSSRSLNNGATWASYPASIANLGNGTWTCNESGNNGFNASVKFTGPNGQGGQGSVTVSCNVDNVGVFPNAGFTPPFAVNHNLAGGPNDYTVTFFVT